MTDLDKHILEHEIFTYLNEKANKISHFYEHPQIHLGRHHSLSLT